MAERVSPSPSYEFLHFLKELDRSYCNKLADIPIFQIDKTSKWNNLQIKRFAAVFYHIRGYFIDFMWYLANFTASKDMKEIVLQNINEELGLGKHTSHEKLYEQFASECGVNIHAEIATKTNYLDFAKEFNKAHIQWLTQHDEETQFAAFAAYERLDNIDYPRLLNLAESLRLPDTALTFFRIHSHVEHFEPTLNLLYDIWEKSPDKIHCAFNFIFSHQCKMWEKLSDTIFNE